jgi:hypothetical protein
MFIWGTSLDSLFAAKFLEVNLMKKVFIIFLLLLLSCSSLSSATEITEKEWLADLNYLEQELPAKHKNLFFQLEKDQFEQDLEEIKAELSDLNNLEISLRLAELFAKIGDIHTAIDNTRFIKKYYPVYFKKFADGYRVTTVDKEYQEILGAKLNSINYSGLNIWSQKIYYIFNTTAAGAGN